MRFGILGPLQVVDDGGRELTVGGSKPRALVAILLLHAGEAVSSDRLVEDLWSGEPPASAAKALQVHVSRLRAALANGPGGKDRLQTTAGGYLLRVESGELDAERFERLLEEGGALIAAGNPERAVATFSNALELWRGGPLCDFEYDSFAQAEIARLSELRAVALEQRIAAELALGREGQVIGALERLVREHPYRERLRGQLMLALYRTGRQAEALAAYRDARSALVDELGIEPSAELRQLHGAILAQDGSLLRPLATRAAPGPAAEEPLDALGVAPDVSGSGGAGVDTSAVGAATVVARPETPSAQRRKVVTALVCDVTGSTALGEELDPEALHGVMSRCWWELRTVIERHGGTVDKFVGDAVLAVFGIPQVREDDALRAVRAAAEIRERLAGVAAEVGVALSFRAAVNTGLVFVGEGENLAIGDGVNVAARFGQAAAPGEIVLGEETVRLVRDAVQVEPLEPLVVKGKSVSVRAFRLLLVDPVAPGIKRHFETPLVGRDGELGVLRAAWERAVNDSGCLLFTLLGAAGVGKSRLVSELFASLGDAATVLSGRCLHYGEGITFWPLIEALTPVAKPAQAVLELLRSGGAATPEELFFAIRRLLESLALERPVILHVDDLQWGEPMLLDLLDHVADLSRGAPILLLCTARPELLEDRPAWGGGKLNATTVLLAPLAASQCETLLDQLDGDLDREARARVIAASEGYPLFLEEMVALARDRGTLAVPSTIQALLAARLDRLPVEERELLEHGAVEGEVFHRTSLLTLGDEGPPAELDLRLAGLVRKELIRPHPPTLEGDEAFRFHHLLIRDAAYDGLPKATRAELHQRFADWLEKAGRGLAELDEIAGWHLEQAVRYARELGRDGDPEPARRAAEHLHDAGRRAGSRGDVAAGRNLLERALALAPAQTALSARIAADLADQLVSRGEYARAEELLALAERDPGAAALARLTRLEWLYYARPDEATTQTSTVALAEMRQRLERAGEERGVAMAHLWGWRAQWASCRASAAGEEAKRAAEHARAAGEEGMRARALAAYISTLIWGPRHAREVARELETIQRGDPGPYLAAAVKRGRATVCRLDGRFEQARQRTQSAMADLEALGMTSDAARCAIDQAMTEFSAGNPAGALPALQQGDAILEQHGESGVRSTMQAFLAEAHALGGDHAAALAAIAIADELTKPDDILNHIVTHRVKARIALASRDDEAAERCARSAVQCALPTDNLLQHAGARLTLAEVLTALGRQNQAAAEAQAALELYERKGDLPGVAVAQALLSKLDASA